MDKKMKRLPPIFHAHTVGEIRELILAGQNPNQVTDYGNTPLHLLHSSSALREIIRSGGNVHHRSKSGETPLHKQQGRALNVAALIAAGADVNAKDATGDTPLHTAISPRVVFRLLKAGANPNIRNIKGELPEEHYGMHNHEARAMRTMILEARKHGRLLKNRIGDYLK